MRFATALAMLAVSAGTASAADCSALQIRNSVKMEPVAHYGVMVVPITLNGVEKKFLFDTGGGLNAIFRDAVRELKLVEYHSNYHISDLYGGDSDSFVQVRDVELGAAKTSTVQLQVMDDPGAAPFDGILSTGFFLHDDIDLDFGAERVNFFSTDHCEGRVVYWPHQVLSVVPVKLENGHIDITVSLDGHPLTAMIDTGATRTTLNLDRAVRKIGFSPDSPAPDNTPPNARPNAPKDDPEHQSYYRRFSTLSLDGVTVQNPLVHIRPLAFGGSDNSMTLGSRAEHKDDEANRLSTDMIVGMDVLRHLHIYIAMKEEKLYVTESTPGESVLFPHSGPPAH
jgi:predicted aspartyl protease